MLVSTNLSSLSAQRMLFENTKAASTAMERLATGSKINKAQDDVAGSAIADRMTSQVRGLNMAVKNVNDAMAMLSVADSAASDITDMLQRMRELAIQAATDTNSAADRQYLQDELGSLTQEIDRVATQTQYNGQSLLDGSKSASFQVGASSGQTVGFDFASLSVGSLPNISSASSIDPLTARATVKGAKTPNDLTSDQGFNFEAAVASGNFTTAQLKNFFTVDIDNSGNPVTVDLSTLAENDRKYTGVELAAFIQNQLNVKFGDERFFDLTTASDRTFRLNFTSGGTTTTVDIDLGSVFGTELKRLTATTEQVVTALQTQIDAAIGAGNVAASYDHASREFLFSPASSANTLIISVVFGTNFLFGIKNGVPVSVGADGSYVSVGADGPYGKTVAPNGDLQRAEAEQRYGIKVIYDAETQAFSFSSGTTGNTSQVDVNFAVPAFDASTGVTTGSLDAVGEITLQANLPAAAFMGFEVTGLTDSKFSDTATGFNFSDAVVNGSFTHGQLKNFMSIDIDDSGAPVIVDFSELAEKKRPITGREMADAIYNQLYEKFGEKRFFDLSIPSDRAFKLNLRENYDRYGYNSETVNIDLGTVFTTDAARLTATTEQVVTALQTQIDAAWNNNSVGRKVTASYDYASREFLFSAEASVIATTVSISSDMTNSLFGTLPTALSVDANGSYGQIVTQNGDLEPTSGLPTYDLHVDYDAATETFSVFAEEDGAAASVNLSFHVPEYDMTTGSQTNAATADGTLVTQFNDKAASFMGVSDQTASTKTLKAELLSREALLSWSSKPAVARGGSIAPDLTRDIWVDPSNSFITVNSDGVEGSFSLTGGIHSLDSLIIEIEKNINQLSSSDGRTISGVNVSYDPASNGLVFTTGTKGPDSYIEVSGSLTWGLKDVERGRGFLASSLADDIAGALETVTAQRAEYGAMQNRLQYTISNLMNVNENTVAARSRIEDADFATESAVLAKAQVLQQSGAAMLAQANARPQLVLKLIK